MAAWALVLLLAGPGAEAGVRRALERSGINRAGLSVMVGRAGEAVPLFSLAPGTPRIPASNQKILTAAAAVTLLGADHHFRTVVARGGNGELVVIGGGDPNLSGRFFDGDPNRVLRLLARDLKREGVKEANGIVLDASRFDGATVHPDWPGDQLDRWYCAPVAALVFNDSCWDVTVRPGAAVGAPALIDIQPSLVKPALSNRCSTVVRNHVVHIGRSAERTAIEIRGRILLTSKGIGGHVTVRDPVRFFGDAFRAALVAEGIRVKGTIRIGRVPGAREVLVYRSSLARTLKVMLSRSQNLYAECVFKSLGSGSFEAASRALLGALEIDAEGLVVRDGSGMARTNRVTARALYQALQAMRKQKVFVDALATGGSGTLRRRYKHLAGRLHAKTGYIAGVSALSGYLDGHVFVILANGRSIARARKFQDLVVAALADA